MKYPRWFERPIKQQRRGLKRFLISVVVFAVVAQSVSPFFYNTSFMQQLAFRSRNNNSSVPLLFDKSKAQEKVEKRTSNARFYETQEKKGIAEIYQGSINYQTSLGAWNPIDNRITISPQDGYVYVNKSNRFEVRFKAFSGSSFLNIRQGQYSVSLGIRGANKSKAEIKDNTITYKNILSDIDIQYEISGDYVKENIILKNKPKDSALEYFINASQGLKLVYTKERDFSIKLLDKKGNVVFVLGAPSVYDFITHEYIIGEYEITKNNFSQFGIKMSFAPFLPKDELGYPVMIDPNLVIPDQGGSITDCVYVVSNSPDRAYVCGSSVPEVEVGKTGLGEARAYLKFNIPTAALQGKTILGATLGIASKEERASIARINLYRVLNAWSQDTISWPNQPAIASSPESSYTNNITYSWWNFDITQLLKDWVANPSSNYGVALISYDPTVSRRLFYSQYIGTSEFKPYIFVYYSDSPVPDKKLIGIKDWWRYVKTDLSEGSAYVNVAGGNLALSFTDLSIEGRGLDTLITHTYNSQSGYNNRFGYGWTISANKGLSFPNGNRQTVVYTDETGTAFTFYDDDNDNNYVDPESNNIDAQSGFYRRPGHRPNGLNWGLKYNPDTHQYIAKSNNKMTYVFDEDGKILSETDRNGNSLTYNYSNGKLVNITNSSGLQVKFDYNLSGQLESVTDPNYDNPQYHSYGSKVTYEYDETGNLVKVNYYSGDTKLRTITYVYDSGHRLTNVIDAKGLTTTLRYDAQNRVYEILDANNKKTAILYDSPGLTKVILPKGFEEGNDPEKFATYYYYRTNQFFQTGIVYKELSPVVKNEAGAETRSVTEYDYNDDYFLHATVGPKYLTDSNPAKVDASAYDDISGLLVYQYNANKVLSRNTYSYATYETGDWRLLDTYDGNGVQTMFYYDEKGNLVRKAVLDGEAINLLHNAGFESASRSGGFDPYCQYTYSGLAQIGDYWCTGRWSDGYQRYERDAGAYTDGLYSQVIRIINNNALNSANVYQIVDETTKTEPNTTYTLKFKYKMNNPNTKFNIWIYHDDSFPNTATHNNTIRIDKSSDFPYSEGWAEGSFAFTTPEYNPADGHPYWTSEIFFRLVPNQYNIPDAKLWIDSVVLQKQTNNSSYIEKFSTFQYNTYGQIIKETTPEGKDIRYEWDTNGNLTAVIDALGNRTEYTYDADGNKLSETQPKGVATSDNPNDFKTIYTYNGRRQITSVIDAQTGYKTLYNYDENGNLKEVITPNNLKTVYVYDNLNRVKETINPYGFTSKVEYDANGNPKGIVDPNRKTNTANFDPNDRLEKEIDSKGVQTNYSYDASENVKTINDNRNMILSYNYDKDDRLVRETNNSLGVGKTILYSYDKADNITQTTLQSNDNLAVNYSTTNEITKVTVAGQTTTYTRNKNNQLIRLDKPNGDYVKYSYDANARLTKLENLRGTQNIISYEYSFDANGNRNALTIVKGNDSPITFYYEYDNQNQLTKTVSPSGTTLYSYDRAGNLIYVYKSPDDWTVFFYEGNRLYKKINASGAVEYFGYDANGNMTSRDTGDMVNMLLHFNGDLLNQRDHQAGIINDDEKATASYVQGKFGQALKLDSASYISYSSSSNISKDKGTIEFWFSPNWGNDRAVRTLFDYAPNSTNYIRIKKNTDNSLQFYYVKDGKDYGVKSSAVNWVAGSWYHLAVTWDTDAVKIYVNGAKVGERILCSPAARFCTAYLNPISVSAPKIVFGALVGNSISEYADGVFDEARVSSVARSEQEIQAAYNNVTEFNLSHTTTYEYDSDDYLTKITKPDGTIITYTYDSNKRLVKRQAGNEIKQYQYDGDKITLEADGNGNVLTKYIYDTEGALLYIEQSGIKYYPVYDGLGSIISLRDSSGTELASYQYDEWGRLTNKTGNIDQPLKFASYWYDETAGLYHLGARWYDPTLMRFVSVDPHPGDQDDPQSLNEYLYTANNPVNRVDPDGDIWNPIESAGQWGGNWLYTHGYGDATLYLSDTNKYWRFAMDHPYLTGAAVGVAGGVAVYGVSYGVEYGLYQSALRSAPKNLLKQTKKQLIKQVKSQTKVIKEHLTKIKNNPKSRDVNKWKKEIKAAKKIIKYSKRMMRFKK